jgi:hypothetical protein
MRHCLTSALILIGVAGPALAADPTDPDWPCIQRKVEHLSIGVMWPHPIPEEAAPLPEGLGDVAAQLALRRVSETEAQALVAQVAAENPEYGLDDYGRVFQDTFGHIDRQRSEIIAGISRYAQNQARLSDEIEALRAEMAGLEAAEAPDFDRMDEVEAEIDWRIRIFNDRNRALTYVCESPVLLEQRAYAIAQMLLAQAG